MNHLQTQYIRFPTITRLLYNGEEKNKPQDPFKTTRTKLTNSKPFFSNGSDPDSFKLIMLPNQHEIMNICTLSLPKRQSKIDILDQVDQNNKKKGFLKAKKSATCLTGINFSVPRKASLSKIGFGLNFTQKKMSPHDIYTQVMNLLALHHGVAVTKPLVGKVRRARVEKGNNGYLVKQIIKKRNWWNTTTDENISVSLIWTQHLQKKNIPKENCAIVLENEEKIFFQRNFQSALNQYDKVKQLFFTEWEEKPPKFGEWVKRLQAKNRISADNLTILNQLPNHSEITSKKNLYFNLKEFYELNSLDPHLFTPKTYHITSFNWQNKISEIKEEENKNKNKAWLLKPGQLTNQGRGILVFKNIQQALDYLIRHPPKGEERSLILQAYIKPILYEGRKFDIRCFMLGVQVLDSISFYWYNEGYIRTASDKFTFKNTSKSIHLTNDAVQKSLQNYDKYESANKLSYSDMEKYLHNNCGIQFFKKVVPEMKKIARDACMASQKIGGPTNSVYFQLFGLDFILNEKGKPFLLQVNTNPSLQICSNLLSRIIPEVVENSFRLVLDVMLPSHKGVPDWAQSFILNNKYSLLHKRPINKEQS